MILHYPTDEDIPIPAQGTWPRSLHRFDPLQAAAAALRAAEACGRPLLIRGAPGVGKSQTARAAAAAAGRPFLSVVIDGRTEPHDLMWRFDAVRRLADAQVRQRYDPPLRSELAYLIPQALWWAFDWQGAHRQLALTLQQGDTADDLHLADLSARAAWPCQTDADWLPAENRAVVLIDEIDKADPDLPNALLEVLANNGFQVPHGPGGARPVVCSDATRPLVVITTNEERDLPNAFLRRCLVLTLELPKDKDEFCTYLVDLGNRHQQEFAAHWGGRCMVLKAAAERLWAARDAAPQHGEYQPGTAEYLDLVRVLATLWPDEAGEQGEQLLLLDRFTFKKSVRAGG